MRFAKPQIVKNPFEEGLAIAYPYVEGGEWIHKDDLKEYLIEKHKRKLCSYDFADLADDLREMNLE